MIKVVHICTSRMGGAGIAAYRIHIGLLNLGINSHFICLDENKGYDGISYPQREEAKKKEATIANIITQKIKWRLNHHLKINLDRNEKIIKDFLNIYSSLKCEAKSLPFSNFNILEDPYVKNADVIHLHWVAGFLDYPSFFTKNTKPVIWTLHDMNPFQGIFHYKEDEKKNSEIVFSLDKRIKHLKQKNIRKRKAPLIFVSPSKWMLESAQNSRAFKYIKGYNIPYPINTETFNENNKNQLKKKLNIPEAHIVFLFVAEHINNYRKGLDLLSEAFKYLIGETISLLIIGHSNKKLFNAINIIEIGKIDNELMLSEYYSLADAFIIPSREDNLPNVMLESMACGTPVISFNVGGMAEYIQDGFNGIKAKKIGAEELAMILKEFITKSKTFNRKLIREFAIENFSEKTVSKRYKKIYEISLKLNA